MVKPQRGNFHGLIPQLPAKQFTMKKRDTHSMQSAPNLSTRPSEPPSLLPIQGVSYTFKEQLPIQGSPTSMKISMLSYLDH